MKLTRNFSFLLLITVTILLSAQAATYAQAYRLTLAQNIDEWSEPQSFEVKAGKGSTVVSVKTKLSKHFGATGKFEVEIINKGPQRINAYMGLKPGINGIPQIHINNSVHISLKANYKNTFNMELRECLPKGRKKMNDLEKCVACEPLLIFAETSID